MNSVILIGRLTRDPEVRYTANQDPVARFTVAIDRTYGQDKKTDYPNVICFGKTAALVEKYVFKGSQVGVQGRIQTGSYEKDGHKVYTTDVVADRVEFLGGKEDNKEEPKTEPLKPAENDHAAQLGFLRDDDLPF